MAGTGISADMQAALESARRLHGHPVHPDTLRYWHDLVHRARRESDGATDLAGLIAALETALADHPAHPH